MEIVKISAENIKDIKSGSTVLVSEVLTGTDV
jgi:hypothetical protein